MFIALTPDLKVSQNRAYNSQLKTANLSKETKQNRYLVHLLESHDSPFQPLLEQLQHLFKDFFVPCERSREYLCQVGEPGDHVQVHDPVIA